MYGRWNVGWYLTLFWNSASGLRISDFIVGYSKLTNLQQISRSPVLAFSLTKVERAFASPHSQ